MERELENRFDRLSPRMRECLRLAYNRKTYKQIANELGVEEGTVKGYMAEAIRLLGARGKFDAAEALHAHEETAPSRVQEPSGGVVSPPPSDPTDPRPIPPWWRVPLPFRPSGATSNDLTVIQRLVWIPGIALVAAIGFGMLAAGLHFLSDIVARFR